MTNLPPRPKPPGEAKTFVAKTTGALAMLGGTVSTAIGVISLASPEKLGDYASTSKEEAVIRTVIGLLAGFIGKSLWDVGQFSKLTREANKVDELLLERASIDKELQAHSR